MAEAFDYMIVGQGLAGSCLALQLLRRNKSVVVFDQPEENHASAVAAGLFNPVTGKVMAKTWLADTLFPYLFEFYPEAEWILKRKFFYPRPLYRPFISVQEQNGWMSKSADDIFAAYIEKIFLVPSMEQVHDPFGGILLKRSGYIDVPAFLESTRYLLKASGAYREEKFVEAKLVVEQEQVTYGAISANKIIFCNGLACNKGYFSWLPINPLKGETLQIQMASFDYIFNRGVYVVPARISNEYIVGATYDFQSQLPGITTGGRAELEGKLRELMRLPHVVINQNWGMRPTTLDQKVILGPHPGHNNLIIFNGFGTKGVSLAPYFSGQLAAWLEGETEILPEVNIKRFKSLYSKL